MIDFEIIATVVTSLMFIVLVLMLIFYFAKAG